MIKPKGVVHFTIPITDLARSEDFYTRILGLELVRSLPDYGMVFLKAGDDYLVLGTSGRDGRPFADEETVHHAFLVDPGSYDSSVAFLKENGVEMVREENRPEGIFPGRSAYFLDPDGNMLELSALSRPVHHSLRS
jgi:catechol 2,3-dioxygenase-like lactoylglutathione lyase family enzyme